MNLHATLLNLRFKIPYVPGLLFSLLTEPHICLNFFKESWRDLGLWWYAIFLEEAVFSFFLTFIACEGEHGYWVLLQFENKPALAPCVPSPAPGCQQCP